MNEVLEEIDELPKPALLERADLPLIMLVSMSISVLDRLKVIVEFEEVAEGKRKYLFTTSLIGATIQDGDKRKRSDVL